MNTLTEHREDAPTQTGAAVPRTVAAPVPPSAASAGASSASSASPPSAPKAAPARADAAGEPLIIKDCPAHHMAPLRRARVAQACLLGTTVGTFLDTRTGSPNGLPTD